MEYVKNTAQRVQKFCTGKSRTQQSLSDQCNINNIMQKFQKTGQLPKQRVPLFMDTTVMPRSYPEAFELMRNAEKQFMLLPPRFRAEMGNDPVNVFAFVQNKENRERAIELGLIEKPAPKQSQVGTPLNPPALPAGQAAL